MNRVVFLAITLLLSVHGFSQTATEIFKNNEVVWYGLDFSKSRLIGSFTEFGSAGTKDATEIKNKFFKAWNDLIINEPEKFNIKKALKKNSIKFDLGAVEKNNSTTDATKLIGYDKISLTKENVQEMISKYEGSSKEGIGFVFVIENLNKIKDSEIATMYVTFFDIASKKVLLTELMTAKPGGFGLRNYWAGAFNNVIKAIDKKKYSEWKKQYEK